MLRDMYSDRDDRNKQRVFVSAMIMLGAILVAVIVWGVLWQPPKPAPPAVLVALPVAGSVGLLVLGFLRALDIGSGKYLGAMQAIFAAQTVLHQPQLASVTFVTLALIAAAPFVGYGIGRLWRRLPNQHALRESRTARR